MSNHYISRSSTEPQPIITRRGLLALLSILLAPWVGVALVLAARS